MITNKGKDIIAKYLIGITPAYASYMAFGCGAQPLTTGDLYGEYSTKDTLDFEMFRVPISSRGYVEENGVNKIVFTSELPNLEQYGMTEIGIYPSGSNPTASTIDSRVLFNFSDTENWEYHSDLVEKPVSYVGGAGYAANGATNITNDNFVLINSYDPIFDTYFRKTSKEQPRFESKTLMLRGNTSAINTYLSNASAQNVSSSIYSVYENDSFPENQSHIHHHLKVLLHLILKEFFCKP